MSLTIKQENFCLAYIQTGNASEAYRASYSTKNMKPETVNNKGYQLLQKGEIKARVAELREETKSAAIMSREEALERLTLMARVSITDVAVFRDEVVGEDEDGEAITATNWRIKNSDEMTEIAAASIKSVTATKLGPKLEMHDPMSAIQQIAKMQGWESATKFEHTSPDGTMTPTVIKLVGPSGS